MVKEFVMKSIIIFLSSHALRVRATDHGTPPLHSSTVNITVTLVAQDSNIPVFQQPSYMFNISEDTRIDTRIGSVHASQRNPGHGSSIVYEIISGNSEGVFHIHDSEVSFLAYTELTSFICWIHLESLKCSS